MSPRSRWYIAVAVALAFGAPVSAQQIADDDLGVASTTSSSQAAAPVTGSAAFAFAPTITLASAMVIEPTAAPFAAPMPPVMRQSQSVAMMIVGGAALIVGSLIDGDTGTIIMVGGGVVGLVGLFNYLQ